MACCPTMTFPFSSSAASLMRSSVQIAGRTIDPSGMRATRVNMNIAASNDLRNVLAPAKKKFPTDPPVNANRSLECLSIWA